MRMTHLSEKSKEKIWKTLMWIKVVSKVQPCTGTEALYRPYGP